jgi:hypothetical protein
MSNRPRPARVHYYVDADLLGVAKVLVQLRGDVTYPGDPGGPVKGRPGAGTMHHHRPGHA